MKEYKKPPLKATASVEGLICILKECHPQHKVYIDCDGFIIVRDGDEEVLHINLQGY